MNAESLEFEDDTYGLVCRRGIVDHLGFGSAHAGARAAEPMLFEAFLHELLIKVYRRLTCRLPIADERPPGFVDPDAGGPYLVGVDALFVHLTQLASVWPRDSRIFDSCCRVTPSPSEQVAQSSSARS